MVSVVSFMFHVLLIAGVVTLTVNCDDDIETEIPKTTRNEFNQFLSSMPNGVLSAPLEDEEILLDLIDAYSREKSNIFPYEMFHVHEREASAWYSDIEVDVHTGVAFLGFPDNTLPRFRELWFNELMRSDKLVGLVGTADDIMHAPGRVSVKHHFHLVDTSFHADDAIQKYISKIARKSGDDFGAEYYINAWEMEHALQSMKDIILRPNHGRGDVKEKPSVMIFVLNLAGILDGASYTYVNGFSPGDMELLRQCPECRELAGQVLRSLPASTRRVVDANSTHLSLGDPVSLKDLEPAAPAPVEPNSWDYWANEDQQPEKEHDGKFEVNEVRSSKAWARSFVDSMDRSEYSLEKRVLNILRNNNDDPVYDIYRHELARSIITRDSMITDVLPPNSSGKKTFSSHCTAGTWAGSLGSVWLDLQAIEDAPVADRGGLLHAHNVSQWKTALSADELQKQGSTTNAQGSDFRPQESAQELDGLRRSLSQHLSHCNTLLEHLHCSHIRSVSEFSVSAPAATRLQHFVEIAAVVSDNVESGELHDHCAILILQKALVEIVLEVSAHLEVLISDSLSAQHNQEWDVYYNDAINFHNRILSEALEVSNMFVGKGHFSRLGFASEETNHAVARLANIVLRTTRQLVSRPVDLHPARQLFNSPRHEWTPPSQAVKIAKTGGPASDIMDTIHASLAASRYSYSLPSGSDKEENHEDWRVMLPPVYIPKHIDVEVFVLVAQDSYSPIDDMEGFNMRMFSAQIERLKLPNQMMTITVHSISAQEEPSVYLGISSCRRYSTQHGLGEHMHHLSSDCIWRHLQHSDEVAESLHEDSGINEKYPNKQHLAVFLISVDYGDPIYLSSEGDDVLHQSVAFGDSILLVQNPHTAVPGGYTCRGRPVYTSLRNPLGVALESVGSAILGLSGGDESINPLSGVGAKQSSHDRTALSCGSSPFFRGTAGASPQFSEFDLINGQRMRILRSIDYIADLANRNYMDIAYHREYRLGDEDTHEFITKAIEAVHDFDWARAAAISNSLLKSVDSHRGIVDEFLKRNLNFAGRDETAKATNEVSGTSAEAWKLLFVLIASTVGSGVVTYGLLIVFSVVLQQTKRK